MKISRALIKDLSIPVITMAIGSFVGTWLVIQYQQPQIVCYTDEAYQKINSFLIGTVLLVNEGRSLETNLSVSIGEKILPSDIDVSYLSTKAVVLNDDGETQIVIPKLKPHESAEIVFRSRGAGGAFKVKDISSDSGNIRYEEWIRSWWSFTRLQMGIIVLVGTVVFFMGFVIGLIKNDLFTKNPKTNRAGLK